MPDVEGFEVRVGERLPRPSRAGGEVRVTPLMGQVLPRLREVLVGVAARRATMTYGETRPMVTLSMSSSRS